MTKDKYIVLSPDNFLFRKADRLVKRALKIRKKKSQTILLLSAEKKCLSHDIQRDIPDIDLSVAMEHSIFASLTDPNRYNFRFAGQFAQGLSLFEFFDSDKKETFRLKKETRSLFEDSLFHYYSGQHIRAYGGFSNVLKIHGADTLAQYYMKLCEKLLDKPDDSDI
ncbi:hypothetical protein [Spirochaeta isovalerica]|uniref:Uncharacterized protein n=1 Tax=Spirochaeta isovalerica TaxID=150 RepID=A0A841R7M1_9SPIO|nr:hypothetical protein [Spirochaeta isovalerica]MBB6478969.1 hypothetical protein [Spirochaeta isovalerica]